MNETIGGQLFKGIKGYMKKKMYDKTALAVLLLVEAEGTLNYIVKTPQLLCLCIYHNGKMCLKFDLGLKEF